MSPLTIAVHSALRWIVLATGAVAAARSAFGWSWSGRHIAGAATTTSAPGSRG